MQARMLNNRYELLDILGQGGMATVYRGRDTRLGRPVAIKLLHSQYVGDTQFLALAHGFSLKDLHPGFISGKHADLPLHYRAQADQRLRKFRLAVPVHPPDTDYLAALRLQRQITQRGLAPIALHRQIGSGQSCTVLHWRLPYGAFALNLPLS